MLKNLAILLIIGYQKSISPDHGWFKSSYPHGFCRFYPSCSQYAKEAIQKKGLFKGVLMGIRRVGRCNPFTEASVDPV